MSGANRATSSSHALLSDLRDAHVVTSRVPRPVAMQFPDRLRWWRQHRLREQPVPEGHYNLNREFFNYTTFGTRPVSQHLLKDLRNAQQLLAHHRRCDDEQSDGTARLSRMTSSQPGVADVRSVAENKQAATPRADAVSPVETDPTSGDGGGTDRDARACYPLGHRLSTETYAALERFVDLFRPRAASAPVQPSSRTSGLHAARGPSGRSRGVAPLASRGRLSETRGNDASSATSSHVVVLHNPPRLVLHTAHTPDAAVLATARVSRADREQNPRLRDRSEMLGLTMYPLPLYERSFYVSQLCAHERMPGRALSGEATGSPSAAVSPLLPHASDGGSDAPFSAQRDVAAAAHIPGFSPTLLPSTAPRVSRGRHSCYRRAASQPALPLLWSSDLLSPQDSTEGRPGSPTTRRRRTRDGSLWQTPAPQQDGGASAGAGRAAREGASDHLCRRLADLQDAYIFNPLVDGVGQGAFSQVYAAVPFAQRISALNPAQSPQGVGEGGRGRSMPVVALKIIARKGKQRDERRQRQRLAAYANVPSTAAGDGSAAAAALRGTEEADDNDEGLRHEKTPHEADSLRDSSRRRELVEVEREISILRQLQHSGCSVFYEALRTPDAFVIAMKLNKGSMDARQFLSRFGPPSEARSALMVYQLVETVHYLHNVFGILHRDIKLENVLVSVVDDVSVHRVNEVLGPQIYKDDPRASHSSATYGDDAGDTVGLPKAKGGSSPSPTTAARDAASTLTDRMDRGHAHPWNVPVGSPTTPAVLRLPSTAFEVEGARSLGLTTIDTAALSLRATLIDFGLARRIHAPASSHRQSSAVAAGGGAVGAVTPSAGRRPGMPTPLPSTANMLTGFWEVEEESGASSTDVSASQTEEDEADADTADDATAGVRDKGNQKSHSTCAVPVAACAGGQLPPRTPSSAVNLVRGAPPPPPPRPLHRASEEHFTSVLPRSASVPVIGPCGDVRVAAVPGSGARAEGEKKRGTLPPSLAFSSGPASMRTSAATTPIASRTVPRRDSPAGPSACNTAAPGNVADDASTVLLTPCGTERYLAPEMLDWILRQGWTRRPTSVRAAKQLDMYALGVLTYVFLSGCFPFNGSTRATLAQQQKRVPRCSSEHWRGVSSAAISFVQGLLEPDPERRLTAEAALRHPFLREAAYWAAKLNLVPGPISAETGRVDGSGANTSCRAPGMNPTRESASPHSSLPTAAAVSTTTTAATKPRAESFADVDALVDHLLRDSPTRPPMRATAVPVITLASAHGSVSGSTTPIASPAHSDSPAVPPATDDDPMPPRHRLVEPDRGTPSLPQPIALREKPPTQIDAFPLTPKVAVPPGVATDSLVAAPPGAAVARRADKGDDDDLFDELYNHIMSSD